MCPAVIARTADVPLHHPHHDSLGSADAGDESRCPFLAALRTPPMVNMPWLQRVKYQVRPSSPAQHGTAQFSLSCLLYDGGFLLSLGQHVQQHVRPSSPAQLSQHIQHTQCVYCMMAEACYRDSMRSSYYDIVTQIQLGNKKFIFLSRNVLLSFEKLLLSSRISSLIIKPFPGSQFLLSGNISSTFHVTGNSCIVGLLRV